MQLDIINFDGKKVGSVELDNGIFGLEPRADILHRVVTWQRAKQRAGTHAVKTVSDVQGSGKKAFKQKKTGNARQGERYNVHMRGGGVVHGPVVRDHSIDLPKKVRSLGLKMALSSKVKDGSLVVIDSEKLAAAKTNAFVFAAANFSESMITKLPSCALEDKAIFKPKERIFFGKSML